MPRFYYTARTKTGEKTEGILQASDRTVALSQIEHLGHIPVSVKQVTTEQSNTQKRRWHFSLNRSGLPKMTRREMLIFSSELSDLLASGMKLGNALNTLSHRGKPGSSQEIITQLRDEIIQGSNLSDALSDYPKTFPKLYISMVKAGEISGNLAEVMNRIVTHYERSQEVREKVIMALVYPFIVLLVGIATIIFALIWVIPKFSGIFEELGSTLPLPTRILIAISSGLIHYGWLIAILLVGFIILIRRYLLTETGQLWWHGFQLKLPIVRRIVTASAFNQFSRTLQLLIVNGVSVLDALTIVQQTIPNTVIAREIQNAKEKVTDGTTISKPLSEGHVFPSLLTDMLSIGEETGDMAGSLSHIAHRYESELNRSLQLFTTLLEPISILFIAAIVGFVAISVLLAVFDLTSGLNI
jgi:type II secretory pathway component PulF